MELVRRSGELALLEKLWASAHRGEGAAALVTGSPGTGQSALLDALAHRAAQRGARVLHARASPAEASVPFGVVGQLLSTTARAAREDPQQCGGGPGALHDTLRAPAGRGPWSSSWTMSSTRTRRRRAACCICAGGWRPPARRW